MRPGVNGTFTSTPASFAAFSTAAQPPSTIRSASETFLPELLLDRFELCKHRLELRRLVDLPVLLRARGGCARRWRRRACRSRGTSMPTPRRSRRAATPTGRRRESSPSARRCPRRRSADDRRPGSGPARSAFPSARAGRGSAAIGPMSRCVSLNQARANASANWSGCS